VLRYRLKRDCEGRRDFPNRLFAPLQALQDPSPRWVGQSVEHAIDAICTIFNHMVEYLVARLPIVNHMVDNARPHEDNPNGQPHGP
jgi:hypothetical protein